MGERQEHHVLRNREKERECKREQERESVREMICGISGHTLTLVMQRVMPVRAQILCRQKTTVSS